MAQTINVDSKSALFMPTLYYSQGDVGRTFEIVVSSSDGFTIPSGATCQMVATKPSGLGFTVAGTVSGNKVTFTTTAVMTDEWGRFPAELRITSGNTVIGTANFYMEGERNPHPDGTTDGSQETLIPELTLLVERAENAAQTATDDAIEAASATIDEVLNYLPTEVTNLKSDINLLYDGNYTSTTISSYTSASGWKLNSSNDGLSSSDSNYKLVKYRVAPNDIILVSNCDRYQFQSAESVPSNVPSNKVGDVHTNEAYSVCPSGATYLIVSALQTATIVVKKFTSEFVQVDELRSDITAITSNVFPLESGSLADEDGTTKVANNKRIRTSYPIALDDVTSIQMPTDYVAWVFVLDENKALLNTLGNWVSYIEKSALSSSARYLNIAIKKSSAENSDISGYVFDVEKGLVINTEEAILMSQVDDRKKAIDYIESTDFELGELYVNSSGTGTYYISNTKMRTIKNHPIALNKGDVVGLSDYSNAVFLVYKKTGESTYQSMFSDNWMSHDGLIVADGSYEILLKYPTEATITNADEMASLFFIKKNYGIVREDSNIENLTDVYKSELDTTIASARAKTTSRGLMFGVITDTHLDNKRVEYYNQTMENLERLNNGLQFNGIFHLGDIINGYDTADIAKYHLQYAMDRLLKIGAQNTYVAVGNHDNNNGAGDAQRLKDYELYSYIQRYNEHYVNRTMDTTNSVYGSPSSNYYVDYPTFKIRMIVFDSCYYSGGFSDDMIAWMSALLASTPSDYHFVFFTHESTEAALNGGVALGNATAFKNLLAQYKDRIYCYIHGHSHYDYVGYDNEFVQIALCCAVPDQPSSSVPSGGIQPSRTIGTVTQDCISVIIILPEEQKVELVRFGAGDDRTIPFRQ